jgi:hypothetical protein
MPETLLLQPAVQQHQVTLAFSRVQIIQVSSTIRRFEGMNMDVDSARPAVARPIVTDITDPIATSRWFSAGRSSLSNSAGAAREACRDALGERNSSTAKLAIVFAGQVHCNEELLAAIRSMLPECQVIGCSTSGEIAIVDADAQATDASVVVALLGGDDFHAVTTHAPMHVPTEAREQSAQAARIVNDLTDSKYRTLLALTDGMSISDQCEVVRGVYESAGALVPLVGGCAGDDLRFAQTNQFLGEAMLTNSLVMAAIGSDSPMGIGVAHGWRGVGEPMFATAVEGTQVLELDNRPAVDVYLERLGADPALANDLDSFTQFALTHPLALIRRRGDEIRWVNGADLERKSLRCSVDIQRNAQVWLTEGDCQSTIDAVEVACAQAIEQLEGRPAIGAIAFNCAARRAVLGTDGLIDEVGQMGAHLGGIPVAGFYTYGEFARVRGPNGFHNQTLVVLAFS